MNKARLLASLILPLILITLSLLLQFIFGNFPLDAFRFPINMLVIAELFVMSIILHIFFNKKSVIQYLSSSYAALSSISLFAVLVIIMVLIPQDINHNGLIKISGFGKITHSWLYVFSTFYIIICLGMVTVRRLLPLNLKNIFFFINHFGLWIVLAAASLGQADKVRINITVPEEELIWYGYTENDQYFEPNFAIKLNKFNIEFYNPKLGIVDDNGEMLSAKDYQPTEIIDGGTIMYKDYKIEVVETLEDAISINDSVMRVMGLTEKTYVASLKVSKNGKEAVKYYIQSGTSFQPLVSASIDKGINLVLLNPEPKYFGSEIELFTIEGVKNEKHIIEVNKPLKLNSWTIYQTSYFKSPEYEGYISVFTAVFDPWLKIVYIGFALMFIGAGYLIFSRRTRNKSIEE